MRISIRLLILSWIILFIFIGVILFNAYSKFNPEKFIEILTEQLQESYPNSKLNVGKISYRFSMDFNVNLQDISLLQGAKLITSIGEVELKVPWWLLLINEGSAQVNLKDLNIYVDHNPVNLNTKKPNLLVKSNKIKIALPQYLLKTKYTIRAFQISIRDIESGKDYFSISKLLVRDFQYSKKSVFELGIPISLNYKDSHLSTELWLFGDLSQKMSMWYLNFRGEFRNKENNEKFQIEDLVIGGNATVNPRSFKVDSDVNLLLDKNSIGVAHVTLSQEMLDLNMIISSLPISYFRFIQDKIKNPYLASTKALSEGVVNLKKMFNSSTVKLKGKLSFDDDFQLSNNNSISGKWRVGVLDSRWELSFMSPKGDASFFRRFVVDNKSDVVSQYVEEIGFSGLDLPLTITPLPPLNKFISEKSTSYYTTSINYKKCLLGEQVLDGSFKYGFTPDQIFYIGEIIVDKNYFKLSYQDKNSQKNIDLLFKNFTWDPSFNFLSPIFIASKGSINGSLQGQWNEKWDDGKWLINIVEKELVDQTGSFPEFVFNTLKIFDIQERSFKKQALSLTSINGSVNLNSLVFEGPDFIKITGKLDPHKKSTLNLIYKDNKFSKKIKKDVLESYWILKDKI
jgi:hypothetical protein